jgi:hypothetical protein
MQATQGSQAVDNALGTANETIRAQQLALICAAIMSAVVGYFHSILMTS